MDISKNKLIEAVWDDRPDLIKELLFNEKIDINIQIAEILQEAGAAE
jgi:hypothetical protein